MVDQLKPVEVKTLPLKDRIVIAKEASGVLKQEIAKGPQVNTVNFLNAVDQLGSTISDDLPQGRVLLESLGKFPQVYVFACNAIGDNLKQAYKDSDTKEILHNLDRAHLLGITSQPKLAPLVIALEKKFRPKEEVKAAETEVAGAAGAAITLPSATSEETKPDALASLGIRPTATKPAPAVQEVKPTKTQASPTLDAVTHAESVPAQPAQPTPVIKKPAAPSARPVETPTQPATTPARPPLSQLPMPDSLLPKAVTPESKAAKTPEQKAAEGWQELREALWETTLRLEKEGKTSSPPSERELAAAGRIALALSSLDTTKAAQLIKSYPKRFRNAVMPVFEKMFPERCRDTNYALYALWEKKFTDSLGGCATFEQAVANLVNLRKEHDKELFARGYSGHPSNIEHSRLMVVVMELASQVDLNSATDPEAIIRNIPDFARDKVFAEVRLMGNKAPAQWQKILTDYVEKYDSQSRQYFKNGLIGEIDRLALLRQIEHLNRFIHSPDSTLPYTADQKQNVYEALQRDIAQRLAQTPPEELERDIFWLFSGYPADVSQRLIRLIINNEGSLHLDERVIKSLSICQDKLTTGQRKNDLFTEEGDRLKEAGTLDEVFFFWQRVLNKSKEEQSRDSFKHFRWEYNSEARLLEEKLSQLLRLPENSSLETLQRLKEQSETTKPLWLGGGYFSDEQTVLLKELYGACENKELQDALAAQLDILKRSNPPYKEKNEVSHTLVEIREKAAGVEPPYAQSVLEYFDYYEKTQEAYEAVLQNPQATQEQIIQAFIERNKAQINYYRKQIHRNQKLVDYEQALAQKAGIRINEFGDLTNNLLEKIPQAPTPVARPATPPSPPPTPSPVARAEARPAPRVELRSLDDVVNFVRTSLEAGKIAACELSAEQAKEIIGSVVNSLDSARLKGISLFMEQRKASGLMQVSVNKGKWWDISLKYTLENKPNNMEVYFSQKDADPKKVGAFGFGYDVQKKVNEVLSQSTVNDLLRVQLQEQIDPQGRALQITGISLNIDPNNKLAVRVKGKKVAR